MCRVRPRRRDGRAIGGPLCVIGDLDGVYVSFSTHRPLNPVQLCCSKIDVHSRVNCDFEMLILACNYFQGCS